MKARSILTTYESLAGWAHAASQYRDRLHETAWARANEDDFTPEILYERLQRRKNTSIKAALLDQSVVAGIGNIYADESLWPPRFIRQLSSAIFQIPNSKFFVTRSNTSSICLCKGGSTDKNYVDAEGKRGSYLIRLRASFAAKDSPVRAVVQTIEKLRVAGRGTPSARGVNE